MLESDVLRDFLSVSPQNQVVLTDYASMEAYNGDSLTNIFKSSEIIAAFPEQVIILKGTQAIGAGRA